jgi:hypothetical protein
MNKGARLQLWFESLVAFSREIIAGLLILLLQISKNKPKPDASRN